MATLACVQAGITAVATVLVFADALSGVRGSAVRQALIGVV